MKSDNHNQGSLTTDTDYFYTCPYCGKKIVFEFKHNHNATVSTTTEVVKIAKADEKVKPEAN